jgi:hypothetical protein
MLGAQGLWAGRDLYLVTPAVTRDLCFSRLIRRTAPFSRLLWLTGCGGCILSQILTGRPHGASSRGVTYESLLRYKESTAKSEMWKKSSVILALDNFWLINCR